MKYKPFTPERFNKLVDEFLNTEQAILGHKGTEYADNEDRLQNFHLQAIVQNVEPAVIALTYLLKHILSIAKAVGDGNQPWEWTTKEGHEGLKQRFADARNYLLLLAACLEETYEKEGKHFGERSKQTV